jgi:anti-sigma factor RsiW
VLDRIVAGELEGEAAATARAHLDSCDVCRPRLATIERDRDAFTREAPPLRVPTPIRARTARWVAPLTTTLALAAVIFLYLRTRPPPSDEGDGTRLKGDGLAFFVARGPDVHRANAGEALRAGDRVQFVLSLPETRWVAILSRDGEGKATAFFPVPGARAERVEAGPSVPLPISTTLDDAVGREDVYAFVCRADIEIEPLRRELEATAKAPHPSGCDVETTYWLKEKPR